jgi:hypothetical protein
MYGDIILTIKRTKLVGNKLVGNKLVGNNLVGFKMNG